MILHNIIFSAWLIFSSVAPQKPQNHTDSSSPKQVAMVYHSLNPNHFQLPNLESFSKAFHGFNLLKEKGLINKNYLTIIDFSLSSRTKRMWVIDMVKNKILFNSLVAHGKNSGDNYALNFSNKSESNQSSLGFFATGEVYNGKHGISLKLDGLEKGINDNARRRAVVVHGANYVSDVFLKNHNRLGRSQGCPAIPFELSHKIIQTIKDKSCLFIYHPTSNYFQISKLIS